jgi:hypothetical protein
MKEFLLDKLTGVTLVKILHEFYNVEKFITMHTAAGQRYCIQAI